MWISRRKLEQEKENIRKEYQKKINYLEEIKDKKIYILNSDLDNKTKLNETQLNRIISLEHHNELLVEQNSKLTEWIKKILSDVGVYRVNDERPISIPICSSVQQIAREEEHAEPIIRNEIYVPSIRFISMGTGKENRYE